MSAHLSLQHIAIHYASKTIVEDVSFELEEGEIGCLLGPSGCGKTTLLRTIAGFEQPAHGTIQLRGNEVANVSYSMPPEQRRVGMVFQDYALFPHLSIEQNIAFGLTQHDKQERQQRVDYLLELIELSHTKARYPHQLSGGQQQRIALARALAPKPDILLLDEPFSNLDVELREQLAHDVRNLIKAEGVTAILVTHDQQEAFATSDRIALLNDGKLVQWGTAYELYNHPNSLFTAEFIGQGSLISGAVETNDDGDKVIRTEIGDIPLPEGFKGNKPTLLIRPDQISLTNNNDKPSTPVTLITKSFRGGHYLCALETAGRQTLMALLPAQSQLTVNSALRINVQLDASILIAE